MSIYKNGLLIVFFLKEEIHSAVSGKAGGPVSLDHLVFFIEKVIQAARNLIWKPFHTRLVVYDSETPRREDWHVVPILNEVAAGAEGRGRPANLCVIPNCATFAEATLT